MWESELAHSPVALSTATLLEGCRISIGMSRLGEVARKPRLPLGTTISDTSVVAVTVKVSDVRHWFEHRSYVNLCERVTA
jgi:hypothetical protein